MTFCRANRFDCNADQKKNRSDCNVQRQVQNVGNMNGLREMQIESILLEKKKKQGMKDKDRCAWVTVHACGTTKCLHFYVLDFKKGQHRLFYLPQKKT